MLIDDDGVLILGRDEPLDPSIQDRIKMLLRSIRRGFEVKYADFEWNPWSVLMVPGFRDTDRSDFDVAHLLEVSGFGYHPFPWVRTQWTWADNELDRVEVEGAPVLWLHDRLCDVRSWPPPTRAWPHRAIRGHRAAPLSRTAAVIRSRLETSASHLRLLRSEELRDARSVNEALVRFGLHVAPGSVEEDDEDRRFRSIRKGGRCRAWGIQEIKMIRPGREVEASSIVRIDDLL